MGPERDHQPRRLARGQPSFYAGRRPFRYDLFMNGTEGAEHGSPSTTARSWQAGTADHAGPLIHPTIGGRDTTRSSASSSPRRQRRDRSRPPSASQRLVEECSRATRRRCSPTSRTSTGPPSRPGSTVAGLIDAKVTTVVACATRSPRCSSPGHDAEQLLPRAPAARARACSTTTCSAGSTTRSRGPTPSARATCRAGAVRADRRRARSGGPTGNSGNPCAGCNLHHRLHATSSAR